MEGKDPIEVLVKCKHSRIPSVPFDLKKLKLRHKRILLNIDPEAEVDELSDQCSSIDSDTYLAEEKN